MISIFNPALLGFLTEISLYLAGIMLIIVSVASLINNRSSRYGFYIGIAGIILGLLYIVIGNYISNPIISETFDYTLEINVAKKGMKKAYTYYVKIGRVYSYSLNNTEIIILNKI